MLDQALPNPAGRAATSKSNGYRPNRMQAFFGIGCIGRGLVHPLPSFWRAGLRVLPWHIGETTLTFEYGLRMAMTNTAVLSSLAFLLVAMLYRDSPSIVTRPSEQGAGLSSRKPAPAGWPVSCGAHSMSAS
jgi:hypothetical protein